MNWHEYSMAALGILWLLMHGRLQVLRRRRTMGDELTLEEQVAQLRTELARREHTRWGDWQRYMHSLCVKNMDGSLVIPEDKVRHWEGQIRTGYDDLPPHSQRSDMEQVDRYWSLIEPYIKFGMTLARENHTDIDELLKEQRSNCYTWTHTDNLDGG